MLNTGPLPVVGASGGSGGRGNASIPPGAGAAPRGTDPIGIGMAVGSSMSAQFGAGLGALAFPVLGPVGVVAVRQVVAAIFFTLFARPNLRRMTRHEWGPVLGLAACFGLMSVTLYFAIERIGLGLAITIEFLGPLVLAVAFSRRRLDVLCVLAAAVGVIMLVQPGPSSDLLGIGAALLAAVGWISYILLNRQVGRKLRGVQGAAAASIVSVAVWLPIGVVWFVLHPPTIWAIALAAICGVMSSIVPFAVDVLALKRLSPGLFSTLASLHPVWAAIAGMLLLHEFLNPVEWAGLGLVVLSNVVVTGASFRR
ncbi:EamA family transporter [Leucobacter sp. GX24907]